jgi:miniconductance mechanosensitive channel
LKSIRFLDPELKARLCRVKELKEYIDKKESKTDPSVKDDHFFSFSKLTNLGIFRFYAESYLKLHPDVDNRQTIVMRHRPFEGDGLHIQLYLFTKHNQFVEYENVQSEIIEHLLAIMGEFGLKVFQQPTGDDLQTLSIK